MADLVRAEALELALPDMTAGSLGRRPRVKILHGVSLALARGEIVGIVGESGSGKSSLGRCLLRLHEPTGGRLVFDGADITHRSARALRPLRAKMQMIFQDPSSSLNPRRTIAASLSAAFELAPPLGRASDALARAMDEVGLDAGLLRRYPHELSGGQRQRVGIARALLTRPQFVLADEIVSGLDVSTQAQVLGLCKRLAREHDLALGFISHDLAVIANLADRVVVMAAGRIVEDGACRQVFSAPRAPETRALLAAIPPAVPDPSWLGGAAG